MIEMQFNVRWNNTLTGAIEEDDGIDAGGAFLGIVYDAVSFSSCIIQN
jgi:hypothetical protein